METTHLIVGLGNPGREYAATRHNAGFLLVESLAGRWRAGWADEKKFFSRVAKVEVGGRRVLLCQPKTFMNASGEAVRALAGFYRISAERMLVAVDDADLPIGEIRLRAAGSSGGHHGLESIESHLGTRDFPRLRIGIGRSESGARRITGHVLGEFTDDEKAVVEAVLDRAADQAACWLSSGIGQAMSQFNGMIKRPAQEKDTK